MCSGFWVRCTVWSSLCLTCLPLSQPQRAMQTITDVRCECSRSALACSCSVTKAQSSTSTHCHHHSAGRSSCFSPPAPLFSFPVTAPAADFNPVCDAFAHWAYYMTEGRIMVVDVQGWYDQEAKKAVLTDPCIHCSEIGLLDDKDRSLVSLDFMTRCTSPCLCKDKCRWFWSWNALKPRL